MSKLEDYLVTQAGISTTTGGRVRNSAIGNFPAIGEILLSPNEKFSALGGANKFDLLLCDGSVVDEATHPELFDYLGGKKGNSYVPFQKVVFGEYLFRSGGGHVSVAADDVLGTQGRIRGHITIETDSDGWNYAVTDTGDSREDWMVMKDLRNSTLGAYETGTFECEASASGGSNLVVDMGNLKLYANDVTEELTIVGGAEPIIRPYDTSKTIHFSASWVSGDDYYVHLQGEYLGIITAVTNTIRLSSASSPFIRIYSIEASSRSYSKYGQENYIPVSYKDKSFSLGVAAYTPDMTSPDPSVPYRIIGDLT